MRRLLAVPVAALLLAACGGDTMPEAEEPPPDETPEAIATQCTSEPGGYRLEYPEGWFEEECAWLHPEPFELPDATDLLAAAVLVDREPVPFEEATQEDFTRTVLERDETEIDGREAVRMEVEATGEGLFEAGTRSYQVVVDAGDESIVVSTHDVEGFDYERNRQVVDQVADSLELTE